MDINKQSFTTLLFLFLIFSAEAQYKNMVGIPAMVDFSETYQQWDGFGFNYVQTAHTYDYGKKPQDYGGFSILDQSQKAEIVELVFGEDGLKPGIVKMFLDPNHQKTPSSRFDHKTTTGYMREFVKLGVKKANENGYDFQVFTTLYGAPAWATLQKFERGRDLDMSMKEELATYMIDWVKFLKEKEGIPVKYISLHNEGDDWLRWPRDGTDGYAHTGHDYNTHWPPEIINDFLTFMPAMIKEAGLEDVGLSNGETTKWHRFSHWGYSYALANDKQAVENIGILMSHDFYNGNFDYWYGPHSTKGIEEVRAKRPDIHAWSTSSAWKHDDAYFIRQLHGSIYEIGINGFIPWAGIQRPLHWYHPKGDPNPYCAIKINEEGTYEINKAYYFYKQITRAGQPGTKIAYTESRDSEVPLIAFSGAGSDHPDAFVVINYSKGWTEPGRYSMEVNKELEVHVKGTKSKKFQAYRTTKQSDSYADIGVFEVKDGSFFYKAPNNSVTTFFAID